MAPLVHASRPKVSPCQATAVGSTGPRVSAQGVFLSGHCCWLHWSTRLGPRSVSSCQATVDGSRCLPVRPLSWPKLSSCQATVMAQGVFPSGHCHGPSCLPVRPLSWLKVSPCQATVDGSRCLPVRPLLMAPLVHASWSKVFEHAASQSVPFRATRWAQSGHCWSLSRCVSVCEAPGRCATCNTDT